MYPKLNFPNGNILKTVLQYHNQDIDNQTVKIQNNFLS